MKPLLALILLLMMSGCYRYSGAPVTECPLPAGACRSVDLDSVKLSGEGTRLIREIEVAPEELPLSRPLEVHVVAMASSELRWNGVVIGRNGVPGRDRAHEVPGLFIYRVTVPSALVRPGRNQLSVDMSAQHLFLPVMTPIHYIEVAPYETPGLPGRAYYLPAMLTLGALAAALAYFGYAAWSDRRDGGARLLAGVAGAMLVQLVIEVSRAFVAYSYPWHLARVGAIALLGIVVAVLAAAYAARRLAPEQVRAVVSATAAAASAGVVLAPGYDIKAMAAILAGGAAVAYCGWVGRGLAAVALGVVLLGLMLWQGADFLDRAWYLLVAGVLIALVAEQVATLRRARAERDLAAQRADALAERLAEAEQQGEPILAIKDGARVHRVAESDVVALRAADDYCDVTLKSGGALMTTMSLSRFLATLPDRFARVHKSHAVNRAHVTALAPKPGGGRMLVLSDGSTVPVGRSYEAQVRGWLEG